MVCGYQQDESGAGLSARGFALMLDLYVTNYTPDGALKMLHLGFVMPPDVANQEIRTPGLQSVKGVGVGDCHGVRFADK